MYFLNFALKIGAYVVSLNLMQFIPEFCPLERNRFFAVYSSFYFHGMQVFFISSVLVMCLVISTKYIINGFR